MRCCLLPIEGLYSAYDRTKFIRLADDTPPEDGVIRHVIDWICVNNSALCARIPEIKLLVDTKWSSFGKDFLIRRLGVQMIRAFFISMLAVQLNVSHKNHHRTFFYFSYTGAICITVYSFLYELPALWRNGWCYWGFPHYVLGPKKEKRYQIKDIRGIAIFGKVCLPITILLFTLESMMEIGLSVAGCCDTMIDDNNLCYNFLLTQKTLMAICVMFVWIYFFYFLMIYERANTMIISIIQILIKDITFFFGFYGVMICAFAFALSFTFDRNFIHSLITWFFSGIELLQITIGMDYFGEEMNKSILLMPFRIIYILFYLVMFIMVNLLIAIISSTYDKLSEPETKEAMLVIEKQNMMCAMVSDV